MVNAWLVFSSSSFGGQECPPLTFYCPVPVNLITAGPSGALCVTGDRDVEVVRGEAEESISQRAAGQEDIGLAAHRRHALQQRR